MGISKTEYTGELLMATCPTVLLTTKKDIDNVLTVSWAGIASSHPEYVTVAINPKRFSHRTIIDTKKFCINIPNSDLLREVDFCGSFSGKDIDKFEACSFKKQYYKSDYVLIEQCKMHLICTVESIVNLGSHDLFIARVEKKLIDSSIVDIHESLDPIIYSRPNYYKIQKECIGYYGFTEDKAQFPSDQ